MNDNWSFSDSREWESVSKWFADGVEQSPVNIVTNNLIQWWTKLIRQADTGNQKPLLFFKYNRSPVFVGTEIPPEETDHYIFISWLGCFVLLAENWLTKEKVEFLDGI